MNGEHYAVHESLQQHSDRSFSFLATSNSTRRDVVIRTFDRKYTALSRMVDGGTSLEDTSEVARYSSYGTFAVDHPATHYFKEPLVLHAVVRQYKPHTLAQSLQAGDISPAASLAILRDVARGLNSLHALNYSHGRLNANNVLLNESTSLSSVRASVSDYGLSEAAALEDAVAASSKRVATSDYIQADIAAFGKLTRYVYEAVQDQDSYTRNRLDWIIWRCSSETVDDRQRLIGLLDALLDDEVSQGPPFTSLVSAAEANIKHRYRQRGKYSLESGRAVYTARNLDRGSATIDGYRLRDLDRPRRVHLLASMTLVTSRPSNHLTKTQIFDILPAYKIMEGQDQLATPFGSEDLLDPLWRAITRQKVAPLVGEELVRAMELAETLVPGEAASVIGPRTSEEAADKFAQHARVTQNARGHLLSLDEYVRTETVQLYMENACPGITADEVRILRDLGYLVHVPVGNTRVYPAFQFDRRTGLPFTVIKTVHDSRESSSGTPWGLLGWWWRQNRFLDYVAPAEHLRLGRLESEVEQALELARIA